jgi:hypothetical protein
MTIIDYDRTQKKCPACKQPDLVFIAYAPTLWPNASVQYRCKPCATREAKAAGDPLEVIIHKERLALQTAWKTGKVSPYHSNSVRQGKTIPVKSKADGGLEAKNTGSGRAVASLDV